MTEINLFNFFILKNNSKKEEEFFFLLLLYVIDINIIDSCLPIKPVVTIIPFGSFSFLQ